MSHEPKPSVSLCLVVWNERQGCEADVPRIPRDGFEEVYAIDGGSSDGTREYLESEGITVHLQPRPSLNAAYHHAVELCSSDALVVFFPKGTIDPSCVRQLAEGLDGGHELVIAGRNSESGRNEEDVRFLKPRKWGVLLLSAGTSLIWRRDGVRIRDVLHGVKAFTVDSFRRMAVAEVGVTVDLEMVVRAYRLEIGRREIPVREYSREWGESHFPILRTGKRLAGFLWRELFRSRPSPLTESQRDSRQTS